MAHPRAIDYTTSISLVSPFPALKIPKMSSLIAESPHQRDCCVQISVIGNLVLSTSYTIHFPPVKGIAI